MEVQSRHWADLEIAPWWRCEAYASNVAPTHRSLTEYSARLSHCNILLFDGDNVDLGTACGKYFRSSLIVIIDAGESEILEMINHTKE
jgi:large subunit ribosomal protein L30e